jgi:hypothetical protein
VRLVLPADTDIDITVGTVLTIFSRYEKNRATACFVIFTSPVAQLAAVGNKIVPFDGALQVGMISLFSQPTHKSPARAANPIPLHIDFVYDDAVFVFDVTTATIGSLVEISEQFKAFNLNTS